MQKGMSLVEIILYMALFGIFLTSVFSISFMFTKQLNARNVAEERNMNTIVLLESIKAKLKEGAVIETPNTDSTSSILTLGLGGSHYTFRLASNAWKLPSGMNLSPTFRNIVFERRSDTEEKQSGKDLLYISADGMTPVVISS